MTQGLTSSLGKRGIHRAECKLHLEELGAGRNLSGASPLAVAIGHALPVLHRNRLAFRLCALSAVFCEPLKLRFCMSADPGFQRYILQQYGTGFRRSSWNVTHFSPGGGTHRSEASTPSLSSLSRGHNCIYIRLRRFAKKFDLGLASLSFCSADSRASLGLRYS